ncbi:dihydroorotate dehydrogenase [Elasticomyces elasticus]|nr:dihydroorotate dehydrogenase [Elasticomyces elasticus]KAK3646540.1 dihydroorotate dehydrogenase [Elasticomyces elasticus]KAK4910433.1 dihydroorotate dehydrogenase [Elasticomyces elasticus]KAK5755649.1 dihydroorotate dehydrogenase [Elasticomyces elasticus]
MPLPSIDPPLINSSNPWATTLEDLEQLFDCPHTGAVTTRTSLLYGFKHDPTIHQYTFFSPHDHSNKPTDANDGHVPAVYNASLNTLGYSPILLHKYLDMVVKMSNLPSLSGDVDKPFIISVTGTAGAVRKCYQQIQRAQGLIINPLCMEINLSCPNIPDKPPPAYSGSSLAEYLTVLAEEMKTAGESRVAVGIKTPPYTYHDQFQTLIDALLASCNPTCPVDFITAVNTLGSSLVLADIDGSPAISSATGAGIGGMAGSPLHPLALGNVRTIRSMLDQHEQLKCIDIIGTGGVSDKAGFDRMRSVGAKVVGVGTALGREGVDVFEKILGAA